MTEIELKDAATTGLTQDDVEENAIMCTQVEEEEEVEDLQESLRVMYLSSDQGPSTVRHVGVLTHDPQDGSSAPTLRFCFLGDSSITAGSGYVEGTDCNVICPEDRERGMSNKALCFTLKEGTLTVASTNRSDAKLRLRKADGAEILLTKGVGEVELNSGDTIHFGRLQNGVFTPLKIFSLHRAPLPPNEEMEDATMGIEDNTNTENAPVKSNGRVAYPKVRSQDFTKAKKEKKKFVQALAKLKSGKRMSMKEKTKARAIIDGVSRKSCIHEKENGQCNVPKCPYLHRKPGRMKTMKSNHQTGNRVIAVVERWFSSNGYGFAVAEDDGTKFFVHATKFPFDSEEPREGDRVEFDVAEPSREGGRMETENVTFV